MVSLKAIHNHIIFQFEQSQAKHMGISQFNEETDWGFEYSNTSEGMETGRWARVHAVGHEAPDYIKPGMRVCIDKLKWTTSFEFEGEDYWRTDSDQILLIDDSVTPSP